MLAGCDGAGRSSVGGAAFRSAGVDVFDPDQAARRLREAGGGARRPNVTEANAAAWQAGRRLLERAIGERLNFAFETTLAGETMPRLLDRAMAAGIEVRAWYVGLASPELAIERVRRRVSKGGHDIPEREIRRRYDRSRTNLIRLLPRLAELRVYDNSYDADPDTGASPRLDLLLHWRDARVVAPADLALTPAWAKPIVATAVKGSLTFRG